MTFSYFTETPFKQQKTSLINTIRHKAQRTRKDMKISQMCFFVDARYYACFLHCSPSLNGLNCSKFIQNLLKERLTGCNEIGALFSPATRWRQTSLDESTRFNCSDSHFVHSVVLDSHLLVKANMLISPGPGRSFSL